MGLLASVACFALCVLQCIASRSGLLSPRVVCLTSCLYVSLGALCAVCAAALLDLLAFWLCWLCWLCRLLGFVGIAGFFGFVCLLRLQDRIQPTATTNFNNEQRCKGNAATAPAAATQQQVLIQESK